MNAALVLEPFVNVVAGDGEDDFLEAAKVGRAGIERLHLPALRLGVAGIHAKQVGSEKRRLGTASSSSDFDDGVPRVGEVGRDDAALDFESETPLLLLQSHDLLLCHLGQFGSKWLALEQRTILIEVRHHLEISRAGRDEFLEMRIFLRELLGTPVVVEDSRVAELGFDFSEAFRKLLNERAQVHQARYNGRVASG